MPQESQIPPGFLQPEAETEAAVEESDWAVTEQVQDALQEAWYLGDQEIAFVSCFKGSILSGAHQGKPIFYMF